MKELYSKLVQINNESNKLITVLQANGCEWALKRKGPCINCGFANFSANAHGKIITAEDYIQQFENVIKKYDFNKQDIIQLEIYVSGSFFNDNEVQPEARSGILELIKDHKGINKVLVESRPEYITNEKIREAKQNIGNRILEVGIGLETANDEIRGRCINKGFSKDDFEHAVSILSYENVDLLVYLLIKPAYLSEQEAIKDAVDGAKYIFELRKEVDIRTRIEYGPTFVQKGTALYELYEKGQFRPAWLWSVVDVIKRACSFGEILVAPKENELMPANSIVAGRENRDAEGKECSCSEKIEKLIESYNKNKSLGTFLSGLPYCNCKNLWEKEIGCS